MGKINDGVRVAGNSAATCHGLLGVVCTGAAVYAIHSTYRSLDSWLTYALALGLALLLASIVGCFGMHRQIVRRGRCTGRCLLSLYQLAMAGLLLLLIASLLSTRALQSGLRAVVDAPDTNFPYSRMERTTLAPFFDKFFFRADAAYTGGKGGYGWFLSWLTNNCPAAMHPALCDPCTEAAPASYVPAACCPDQGRCAEGTMDACPYKRCRKGVAIYLEMQLGLFQQYGYVFLALQLFVLLNTCLLLCFNPRDSLADLLAKTGILVHHPPPPAHSDSSFSNHTTGGGGGGGNRRSRRYSPRAEHGNLPSPTVYRSAEPQHATPRTFPVYGGSGGHDRARRGPSPPIAVAIPLDEHPHSVV